MYVATVVLRDGKTQFQKLTVNPRRTPMGIRGRHRANQGAKLLRDDRPTRLVTALPGPEEAESAPMPRDDRFRFDYHEHHPSLAPGS
jgi:hypothetical protein